MLIEALIAALNALKPSLRAKVRRTIRQHGVPTNDNELLLLATSLSHELRPQRHRAWELYRRYYVSEALRNGVVADAFAPERLYPTKAMVSGIRRALEWDEGTPGPTVNLELLDPETKRLSMSKLDVTSANRRDKRVVDKFTDKLQPTVERHMLAAGRDAMVDSVESAARKSRVKITDNSTTDLRWARVLTGGENCPFCAMLASRGPVYHNATTALIDGKSVRMDAYHDNCDCIAVPVFGDDTQWQGYAQWQALEAKWQKLTEKHFSRGKYRAFRKDFDEWFADEKAQYVIWENRGLLDAETLKRLNGEGRKFSDDELAAVFKREVQHIDTPEEVAAKIESDADAELEKYFKDAPAVFTDSYEWEDAFYSKTDALYYNPSKLPEFAPGSMAEEVSHVQREPPWSVHGKFYDLPGENVINTPYSVNCPRCTFALELRMRGYDVRAGARTWYGFEDGAFQITQGQDYCKVFGFETEVGAIGDDEALFSIARGRKELERAIHQHPEGARGILRIRWTSDLGGHICNWEKRDGTIWIHDSQAGTSETLQDWISSHKSFLGDEVAGPFKVARTDNKDIDVLLACKIIGVPEEQWC